MARSGIARTACLVIAAAAAGGEAPARADLEVGVFAGAHFYSTDGALGRGNFLASTTSPDYANSAFQHSGIFGLRLAWLMIPRVALEGEVGLSPTSTVGGYLYGKPNKQMQLGVVPLRAHLIVNLMKGRVRPFLLAGGGVELSSPFTPGGLNTDAVGEVHAGGGLSVDVRPWWGLRLEGRAVFPQGRASGGAGTLTTEGEVLLGIYGRFGPPPGPRPTPQDRDGDGVPNSVDRCPDVVGPAVNGGCPDKDGDGDGIVDRLDRCPRDKGPTENGGCPDKDGDGDGIVDRLDRCVVVPGKKEYGGCPDLDGTVVPAPPPAAPPPAVPPAAAPPPAASPVAPPVML